MLCLLDSGVNMTLKYHNFFLRMYMYLYLSSVLFLTLIISYINEGLKFDEQGNKQKALQFYHKGMQNHRKGLLHTYIE